MKRTRHAVALALLVVLVLATASWVLLAPRDDRVGDVDAVVVLGGGGGERVALGAHLAEQRGVPMLVFAEGIDRARAAGLDCGVSVRCVWPTPSTTRGEAVAVQRIADAEGWRRVAVATSDFHVNRARRLLRQCLGGRVDVVGAQAAAPIGTAAFRAVHELAGQLAAVSLQRAC